MIAEPTDRMMHLPDGEYLLRRLTPDDWHRLQEFFYSHTEKTVYQRYGHPIKVMSEHDARKLVSVDQSRDYALALLEVHKQQQIIHAVGRYCMDTKGQKAEMAFVVRESKRQLGCTTCLMQELIRTARQRKLQALWAMVHPDNLPMRKVLQKFCFQKVTHHQDEIILELKLTPHP